MKSYQEPGRSPEERAALLLTELSLDEKMAQLGCVFPFRILTGSPPKCPSESARSAPWRCGGVIRWRNAPHGSGGCRRSSWQTLPTRSRPSSTWRGCAARFCRIPPAFPPGSPGARAGTRNWKRQSPKPSAARRLPAASRTSLPRCWT